MCAVMFEKLKKIWQQAFGPKKKKAKRRVSAKSATAGSKLKKKTAHTGRRAESSPRAKTKSVLKKKSAKKPVAKKAKAPVKKKVVAGPKRAPRKARPSQKILKKPVKKTLKTPAAKPSRKPVKASGRSDKALGGSGAPGKIVGEITHYFGRISVAVLKMTHGKIVLGDTIHFQGKKKGFQQKVKSLQIESIDVRSASKGQLVGLQVEKKVDVGDKVYKI